MNAFHSVTCAYLYNHYTVITRDSCPCKLVTSRMNLQHSNYPVLIFLVVLQCESDLHPAITGRQKTVLTHVLSTVACIVICSVCQYLFPLHTTDFITTLSVLVLLLNFSCFIFRCCRRWFYQSRLCANHGKAEVIHLWLIFRGIYTHFIGFLVWQNRLLDVGLPLFMFVIQIITQQG